MPTICVIRLGPVVNMNGSRDTFAKHFLIFREIPQKSFGMFHIASKVVDSFFREFPKIQRMFLKSVNRGMKHAKVLNSFAEICKDAG